MRSLRSKFRFNRWAFESLVMLWGLLLSLLSILSAVLWLVVPASALLVVFVALAVLALGIVTAFALRRRTTAH